MPDQVIINISDTIPPENYATIDKDGLVGNAVSKEGFQIAFDEKADEIDLKIEEIRQEVESDFKGVISPTDPAPTEDGSYKPSISSEDNKLIDPVNWGTSYPNAGNLRSKKGYLTTFYKKGSNWSKSEVEIDVESNTYSELTSNTWSGENYYKNITENTNITVNEPSTDGYYSLILKLMGEYTLYINGNLMDTPKLKGTTVTLSMYKKGTATTVKIEEIIIGKINVPVTAGTYDAEVSADSPLYYNKLNSTGATQAPTVGSIAGTITGGYTQTGILHLSAGANVAFVGLPITTATKIAIEVIGKYQFGLNGGLIQNTTSATSGLASANIGEFILRGLGSTYDKSYFFQKKGSSSYNEFDITPKITTDSLIHFVAVIDVVNGIEKVIIDGSPITITPRAGTTPITGGVFNANLHLFAENSNFDIKNFAVYKDSGIPTDNRFLAHAILKNT